MTLDKDVIKLDTPDPELIDLEKSRIKAEIAKFEAERHGIELRNEAQYLELQQHKIKATENYIYTFYNPIVQQTVADCINTLGRWTRKAEPGTEFLILINSPGGHIADGLGLYDYIESIKETFPVKIKVFGAAHSMAAVLLQAASVRAMQPNATLMMHEASMMLDDSYSTSALEDTSKLIAKVTDKTYEILSNRSKLTKAEIKRRCNRKEAWLDADEALKLGLIDVIER